MRAPPRWPCAARRRPRRSPPPGGFWRERRRWLPCGLWAPWPAASGPHGASLAGASGRTTSSPVAPFSSTFICSAGEAARSRGHTPLSLPPADLRERGRRDAGRWWRRLPPAARRELPGRHSCLASRLRAGGAAGRTGRPRGGRRSVPELGVAPPASRRCSARDRDRADALCARRRRRSFRVPPAFPPRSPARAAAAPAPTLAAAPCPLALGSACLGDRQAADRDGTGGADPAPHRRSLGRASG